MLAPTQETVLRKINSLCNNTPKKFSIPYSDLETTFDLELSKIESALLVIQEHKLIQVKFYKKHENNTIIILNANGIEYFNDQKEIKKVKRKEKLYEKSWGFMAFVVSNVIALVVGIVSGVIGNIIYASYFSNKEATNTLPITTPAIKNTSIHGYATKRTNASR